MTRNQIIKYLLCLLGCLPVFIEVSLAQSASFGNTWVPAGGEASIISVQHNFQNGGSGVMPGMVGTERTSPQGFLSFAGTASWTGASNSACVDGYVKSYLSGSFIFPIGDNGVFAPVMVSASSVTNPVDAAYFNVNPASGVTSSLKGGDEPALPTGGPFPVTSKGSSVSTVSTTEYWDINGVLPVKLSLSWRNSSNVGALTNNSLTSLKILGWDGTQWVMIPSTIDATSVFGTGTSKLTAGSITTDLPIAPSTYTVYTLGSAPAFATATGTVDCAQTQIQPAPVAGVTSQLILAATLNVTAAGSFSVSVSGSGMTLANGVSSVATATTGVQQVYIPVQYDWTPLSTLTFSVGTGNSCTANLTTPSKQTVSTVWTLACVATAGPVLK